MKKLVLIIMAVLCLTAIQCKDRPYKNEPENIEEEDKSIIAGKEREVEQDKTEYRARLSTRIEEMDDEIEEAREQRKKEKQSDRIKQYDTDIEEKERERKTLQDRLDAIADKTDEEWTDFKRDLDALFDEDRKKRNVKQ